MNPDHLKWMAEQMPNARYHHCPNGSHMTMYDDQEIYFEGFIQFVNDVDSGNFRVV